MSITASYVMLQVVESYLDSLPAEERERTRRWFAAEEYAGHVRMGQEVGTPPPRQTVVPPF